MPGFSRFSRVQLGVVLIVALLAAGVLAVQLIPPTARLTRLLAAGEIDRALDLAQTVRPAHGPAAARALAQWVSAAEVDDDLRATILLRALKLDPAATPVYTALGELAVRYPWPETGPYRCAVEALPLWRRTRDSRPDLAASRDFVRAGALLARGAGRYSEAAEIDPGDIDAQVWAAREGWRTGDPATAGKYAERARALAPDRADVLSLLAGLGMLAPAPADDVVSVLLPAGLTPRWVQVGGGRAVVWCVAQGQRDRWLVVSLADRVVERELPDGPYSSLSPSGAHIARWVLRPGKLSGELHVVDVSTGSSRCVATLSQPWGGAVWAPDEASIAVMDGDGLLQIVRVDGAGQGVEVDRTTGTGEGRRVPGEPQWVNANDGRLLAGVTWHGEGIEAIWLFDPASGTRRTVPVEVPYWLVRGVEWSPDGRYLACELGDEEEGRALLIARPSQGGSRVITTGSPVRVHIYGWLGNTGRLLFSMGLFPEGARHLWIWDQEADRACLLANFAPGDIQHPTPAENGVVYFTRFDEAAGRHRLVGLRLR